MTREVFCDLWGMTEPPPSMSSSSPLPNTATRSTQFLPPLLPASISKKETPSDIRKGSDRRFPSLGVKSGSLKTILQQTNNKLDHTAETTSISSNEAYIHHMINQTNLPVNLPVCNDPEEPNDDDDDDDGNEKEEDEKSNEDNEHEEVENTSEKNEDDDDDDDEKNHESDEDSIDSLSTIGIITEWNDRIKYEKMRIARDFILYTFECLVNICENRLELQDRIAEKSSFFFQSLYGKISDIRFLISSIRYFNPNNST